MTFPACMLLAYEMTIAPRDRNQLATATAGAPSDFKKATGNARDMTETDPRTFDSSENTNGNPVGPRSPRSIRFSDSEWACIEKAGKARGMNAAELVRHAAVNFATGNLIAGSQAFPPEIAAQIERIYRGVYLLSTLKRDEMLRAGQQDTLDKINAGAQESQSSLIQEVSGTTS